MRMVKAGGDGKGEMERDEARGCNVGVSLLLAFGLGFGLGFRFGFSVGCHICGIDGAFYLWAVDD